MKLNNALSLCASVALISGLAMADVSYKINEEITPETGRAVTEIVSELEEVCEWGCNEEEITTFTKRLSRLNLTGKLTGDGTTVAF